MGHHRLVDELEANAFAVLKADRLRFRVLLVVNRPDVAFHVSSQPDLDLPRRFALFVEWPLRLQVGIGEELAAVRRYRHQAASSDARSVGKEGVGTCIPRW